MGNSLFPTLTGVLPNVERETLFKTSVFTNPGGSEQRVSWQSAPRYRYKASADVLLDSLSERANLSMLFGNVYGASDSFWYLDPVDGKLRQVRFEDDSLALTQIVSGMWQADWNLITVASYTLDSVAISPTNPSNSHPGTRQFTATGTLSTTATVALTSNVTWASSATNRATIDAAGLATTVSAGTSTISATFGPLSASTTLTVT